ncbi:MAG: response regulator [Xanthobacteraceae bacterium]
MSRSTSQRAAAARRPGGNRELPSQINARQHAPESHAAITALRILHVDDEPDIREVVELSLTLDPVFAVRSCASGEEALAAAVEWPPDLILCDVMMPVMDGPATLARLRGNPQTALIPVVFMTARAQTRELEHFKSLGAVGVISKPFDPMTLAASVRGHLRTAGLSTLRDGFIERLRTDAAALTDCRADLADTEARLAALEQIKAFSHALAGAAGIFGFQEISRVAAELEKAVVDGPRGNGAPTKVEQALDALLDHIDRVPAVGIV